MIPLVEVVKTEWTDPAAQRRMFDLLAGAGKTPVMVEKDVPGFIGNRLQHALWREAIQLVENGICTAEAVDDVVKASFGRRLAVLGPLENADLVGIELTQDITIRCCSIWTSEAAVALSSEAAGQGPHRHGRRRRVSRLGRRRPCGDQEAGSRSI